MIILAAGAYYGWKAWQEQPEWLVRLLPNSTPPAEEQATPAPEETSPAAASPVPVAPARPTPAPRKFVSRIAIPDVGADGEPAKAPPGTFLVTERASVETKDGVIAIVPGDQVRLIERHKNGTLTVTNGHEEFVVKESQVTSDVAIAHAAEKQDFEKRFGRVQ